MDIMEAIHNRRSIRRFLRRQVSCESLAVLVDAARVAPSTVNLQPLEYIIVDDDVTVTTLFPHARMGALLPKHERPTEALRPAAYIAVLVNTSIMKSGFEYDVGCAVQSILLAALSLGLGACFVRNLNRDKIAALLEVPNGYLVDTLVAVGYPAYEPVVEDTDDMRYYIDEERVFRVPKRKLARVIHLNRF
jgi:nitroreductase